MRWRRSVSTSVLEFLWCVLWVLTTQCPRVKEVGLVLAAGWGRSGRARPPLVHLLAPGALLWRRPACSPQPVPALVARARVPPAAPPAPNDHRHVDQVLVVLVAEEALAQLGQPVLFPTESARAFSPVAQQDAVVGPLDKGLFVVKVLAGEPQAQVEVVVLARPGQLPVRAREHPGPCRRFSTTAHPPPCKPGRRRPRPP